MLCRSGSFAVPYTSHIPQWSPGCLAFTYRCSCSNENRAPMAQVIATKPPGTLPLIRIPCASEHRPCSQHSAEGPPETCFWPSPPLPPEDPAPRIVRWVSGGHLSPAPGTRCWDLTDKKLEVCCGSVSMLLGDLALAGVQPCGLNLSRHRVKLFSKEEFPVLQKEKKRPIGLFSPQPSLGFHYCLEK